MSRIPFHVGASTLLALVVAVPVFAQEKRQQEQPERPEQNQQEKQLQQEPNQDPQAPQQRQAFRRSLDQQGGMSVREALVNKLQKTNEAEIELAQMAHQRVDNPELKQFIEKIIKDHKALNQQLSQAASHRVGSKQPRRNAGRSDAPGRSVVTDSAVSPRRNQQQDRDAQADPQERSQTGRPGLDRNQADRGLVGQSNPQDRQRQVGLEETVPSQLVSIMEKACDNNLEMTKEMLGKYEGQDFQMGFLGQQIVSHVAQLAELKAIASEGPQELQPIAEQAAQKVQSHLEKAQQLAKKFEDNESNDTSSTRRR